MTLSPEELLQSLTTDQKLAQLCANGNPAAFVKDGRFDREKALNRYPHGVFGLMAPLGLTPEEIGSWTNEMRACFREVTPVPPVLICESLHGILGQGATVFPQSIGMGATFDPALMQRIGEAIGQEARAMGIRMSFAPDLDLGRDPRWGRTEETYGESPYLTGEMGAAYVRGLLSGDGKYAATVKHFAAHGQPDAGINLAPVNVSEQELRDRYLPPFEKALKAGAKCVMPAYSALNGLPCHAHMALMQKILREELGFDGVVVSDFGGIEMLHSFHCSAQDAGEAALQAFNAGVDVEAPNTWAYGEPLKKLLASGKITMQAIDRAVLRILRLKAELGLWNLPDCRKEEIRRTVHSPQHLALAREAARKSMVLMKNDGILPLRGNAKVAVIGPNAFSAQLGDYALPRLKALTVEQAIRQRAEKSGGTVLSAEGCKVYGSDQSGFDEAVSVAAQADAVIFAMGGKSMKGYGIGWGSEEEDFLTCGEGCDMHDLTPGGPQLELARALIGTGKPVVIVMIDGRPETLHDVTDACSALIAAWYPGEEGSGALAELLYGDANFSGRLPVTFPRHTGQVPIFHDRLPSASGIYRQPGTPDRPGRDYVFLRTDAAFDFGYGMGYSPVAYSELSVCEVPGGLSVRVSVENTGKYAAEEPVLFFIRDEAASFPQPVKKLCAIARAVLGAGEKKTIEAFIPREELCFTNADLVRTFEKGWFSLFAGSLSTRIFVE